MQDDEAELLFRLNGVTVAPDRVPVFRDAYIRWLEMTAILRELAPYTDEPLFPPARAR